MNDKEGLVPAVYLRPHTLLNERLKETLNLVEDTKNKSNCSPSNNQQQEYFENNINKVPFQSKAKDTSSEEKNIDTIDEQKPEFYYSIDKYVDNAGDGVNLEKGQRVSVIILNFKRLII